MIVSPPVKPKTRQNTRQGLDVPINGNGMSGYGQSVATKKSKKSGIAPWKIVLTSILIGIAGYFYISHVFATQSILSEVNALQREYESAQRVYEDRALTYDRMTGPAEVYRRAGSLGLIHGGANDPIIKKSR